VSSSVSSELYTGIAGIFAHLLTLFIIMTVFFTLLLNLLFLQCGQDLCKQLHQQIDVVDEERYDMSVKVAKSDKEVFDYLLSFLYPF